MHSVSKQMEGIAENTAVVHLLVPFRDKAVVKRRGGWWDSSEKRWCVEVEIALQMSGTELQKYWPPDFDSLLPYLLEVRRKKSGSLSFAEDFCFMLEQNPESTRDAMACQRVAWTGASWATDMLTAPRSKWGTNWERSANRGPWTRNVCD